MDKPRILVVDDTPANLKILSDLLRDDYVLSVATSGARALDIAFSEDRPDLVLLDIMMPVMDGYEVCRRLKADGRTRDVPVIFVTAMTEAEDETKGFDLGAVDYIAKPVSPPVVISRVRSAVALRRKTSELQNLSAKLGKYLPPQVCQAIFEGQTQARIESKRRKLTVFFSDIVGFTTTTERMEAEDMSMLLNSYLEAMSAIVMRHGGTLDKFIGDAIMVFFGDPVSRGEQEDALACVDMAMEMREELARLQAGWYEKGVQTPFRVRIGINTGFCAVGNFGSPERMDYTIIGSQVNIASRLQSLADPDTILISHETWSLVQDRFFCIKRKPLNLKGLSHPVQTYQVVDHIGGEGARDLALAVGPLAEKAPTIRPADPVSGVPQVLGDDPHAFAVVMEGEQPVGLIGHADVRGPVCPDPAAPPTVREVMREVLVLEADTPVREAARQAMARGEGQAYAPLALVRDGRFLGLATVKVLMERVLEMREDRGPERAKDKEGAV